ncbi:hypothetical protein EDD11_001775 [Mortierella claussenii]|nr:hypothetical protein EDD11_001775 [Mortierella claussenii]
MLFPRQRIIDETRQAYLRPRPSDVVGVSNDAKSHQQNREQDPNDAAYMSLLTRTIPGVGDTLSTTSASNTTVNLSKHQDQKNLTEKQWHAIKVLEEAQKDALYISEGEEPFQTVCIVPEPSGTAAGAARKEALSTPLPTGTELLQFLRNGHVLSEQEDMSNVTCEISSGLDMILNKSNPGADRIAKALQDIFQYDSSMEPSTVALYRVALPSSPTKVHLWILGWIDGHLLGFHTISIES